jgi:hypothetical protein
MRRHERRLTIVPTLLGLILVGAIASVNQARASEDEGRIAYQSTVNSIGGCPTGRAT